MALRDYKTRTYNFADSKVDVREEFNRVQESYKQRIGGPDNVYVNISILGADYNNTNMPHKTFSFNNSFNVPLISHINNYYVTIDQLNFPAVEVPLVLINNIVSGSTQTNPNLTDWIFTFTYGGVDYTANVEYIPYNTLPVPAPPSTNPPNYTQYYTSYYVINTYQQLLDMLNTTLTTIYTAMYNANMAAFILLGLGANDAPYFIFDDDLEKFKLIYNKLFVGNGIDLYWNDQFNTKFNGFNIFYYGNGNIDGKDYRVIFANTHTNEYDMTHYFNAQQYAATPVYLNVINNIIVTSNLRVRPQWITTDDDSTADFGNVIFILSPLLETCKDSKSILKYVTNGNYRLIDILSQGDILFLDLNVFYTDNLNNRYVIQIPKGQVATCNMLFVKKTLHNYDY